MVARPSELLYVPSSVACNVTSHLPDNTVNYPDYAFHSSCTSLVAHQYLTTHHHSFLKTIALSDAFYFP